MTTISQTHPTPLTLVCGYFCAVAVAALTAAVVMQDQHAPLFGMLFIGGTYIAVAGLPGFVLTVLIARAYGLQGWLHFTLAGAANALLSWLLLTLFIGSSLTSQDDALLWASIRGGAAGGVAYWWVAYRHLYKLDGQQHLA